MAIIVYPLSVRKAVLKAYSEGETYRSITQRYNVSPPTVILWGKKTGVLRGVPITDEDLDKKIEATGDDVRKAQQIADRINGVAPSRERKRVTDHKYGPPKPSKLPAPIKDPLKGPTSIEDYERMIEQCLQHAAANLERDTSLEGQARHLMLGIMFKQLQTMLATPPTVVTWADADRIFNQVKDLLGMNDKKTASRRIDINILSQKVEKSEAPKRKGPKVFEAEIVKQDAIDLDKFEV
jgi:hypothetical protein